MGRNIEGLPFERMSEGKQTEGYEHGWASPPGVTPQYRARLGHGPETKDPLKRKATGGKAWFF